MGLCKDGYWRESESYEGKQYVATAKGKTDEESQKLALKKLADKIAAAKNNTAVLSKNTTVKTWSEEWLDVYIRPKVRKPGMPKTRNSMTEKSYAMYEQKLDGYVLPAIGRMQLKDVRDVHVRKILNGEAGMSKSHVEKIRIVIKAMFRQAYQSRLINYDPSVDVELPAVTEGVRRSLTEFERSLLHRAAELHRCGLWIRTLLDTGIRPGESAPLLVKDFDFDSGLLNIDKDIESGTYSIADPKTKAGIRKLPIPDDLKADLQSVFAGKGPFDFAFPQTDGKRMKTQECISNDWRSFRRCMDILGGATTIWKTKRRTISVDGYELTAHGRILEMDIDEENGSVLSGDLVLYCLRHTYCTDLQKAGVPINIAAYLMGHADIQTTANIYTHTGEDEAICAALKINDYRKNRSEKTAGIKNSIKIRTGNS